MDFRNIEPEQAERPLLIAWFLIGFLLVWSVRATVLYTIDESIASEPLRAAYSNLLKLLLWVVPAVVYVKLVHGNAVLSFLGVSKLPDRRKWVDCLAVTIVFLTVVITREILLGGKHIAWQAALIPLTPVALMSTFVSPLLEELLFRGLVIQELAALLGGWRANIITSLVFMLAHLPYWLYHGKFSFALMANLAGVFVFSLLANWLRLHSGSIWPSVLAHVGNNYVISLLR